VITVERLALSVGTRRLFDELDFAIASGELLAILGPNGCGKTTLLRTIAGLHRPSAGTVTHNRIAISELNPAERARRMAFIASEEIGSEMLSVREIVGTGRYAYHSWWDWREEDADRACVNDALRAVGLYDYAERSFDTLSSGERQRAWIAMALAQGAPALLLDEPTSHLDLRAAQEILRLLRDQAHSGKCVACVLHDANEAFEYADRFLLLGWNEFTLCRTPDQVLNAGWFERAYGLSMEAVLSPSGKLRVFPLRVAT